MQSFDLIIIGGGPAGYLAAERAAEGGMKVALFEKSSLGGTCLNEGCIPSKALLYSAKMFNHALHGAAYGVTAENVSINQAAVVERKDKVVKALVAGVGAKMKAAKVTVVKAPAVIAGKTASGYSIETAGIIYEADRLLVATGSEAVVPPIPGIKEGLASGFVKTNREILGMTALPEHLVVIGGGVIGLEMVSYFRSVGVKVTVVEMLDKIAGPTEAEISKTLMKEFEKKGVEFRLGCKVKNITAHSVEYEKDDRTESIPADAVLLSIGRRPAITGIGLETIGVYTERGAIVTDEHLRTNVPNVYAAGDVNGKVMLAHTAYREAEVAVNHMLGKRDHMRYEAIPSVIYSDPEVACVGETLDSARQNGLDVKEIKLSMHYSGRFVAENEGGDGICKLIVEENTRRIVGVHMLGNYSSEIIYGAAMMVESRWPADDLKELVFPHPTVGEVIRETLFRI
jgi:dihydrolipoamide dehydrogenase